MPSGTRPDKEVADARRGGGYTDRGGMHKGSTGYKGGGPSMDSRARNPRYSASPIASGPLTAYNAFEALRSIPTSPFGAANLIGGALGIPGLGPQYQGVTPRSATGYSYDGPDRGWMMGSRQGGGHPGLLGLGMNQPRPKPPAPQQPGLGMASAGAMNFGYQPFNGMQGSQWTRPGYQFVGPGFPQIPNLTAPSPNFPGKPLGPGLPRMPRSTGFI
ncbi:MAG: hypothetical protein A4E20_04790 [Nitrospira sp. SG-bin2]|uniref:hypothetical protein n=1 Tax=Nitrospira cf. moscoviensis SBR1015 TaxID=96242 RepID=UPI000A0D3CA5|nr:hypothetical protein [Nitrospira cf. moscoviensis SBR1015]OQW38094.1 MAG: hypothetical protein A4E20_04790 [Nitrospira sp. SG-bin2]